MTTDCHTQTCIYDTWYYTSSLHDYYYIYFTVNSERQDFSNMIQMVTFPPSSIEELQTLDITVFDDSINEATEGYLLMVDVIADMSDPRDVANFQLVNGGISLVVVTDDDGKP